MTSIETIPQIALLGTLAEDASVLERLAFQMNGLIVVFVALCSIWLLVELIGVFFKRMEARATREAQARKAAPAEPAAAAAQPAMEDAELIAVIASAVFYVAGRSARIVSVTPVDADWAREGRRQIFSSHNIR